MSRSTLGNLVASPIVQFFLAGGVVFGLYAAFGAPEADEDPAVVISQAEQRNLVAMFEKTWQRPPTDQELAGLIDARVDEELYYREALALGLDENDVIVRRRMAQKIDFIVADLATGRDPTEAELASYLQDNADAYALDPVLDFEQVFLGTAGAGGELEPHAEAMLAALESGTAPDVLGLATGLPPSMQGATRTAIMGTFGTAFAEALVGIDTGTWSGPVGSAYGAHLVRVTRRQPGRPATLDEVRAAVERDWREAERRRAREAYVDALRQKYRVQIEAPGDREP